MEKYGVFNIVTTSLSNLDAIADGMSKGFELRLCEMSFFAERIARQIKDLISEGMNIGEAFAILSEELDFAVHELPHDVIDVTESGVRGFLKILNSSDKINFAVLLREKLSELDIIVKESDFLHESSPFESFIYVKNSLADEAFDVFSQEFSDPRIAYADSFKEACIAVSDKKYGYCILPFEEKSAVRIPSIAKLVSDLDLKIVAITPVFGFEGNADMKYALIGRDFKIPECDELTDRYFEISIPKDSVNFAELLLASQLFGTEVYKVGTAFSGSENEKTFYSVIFKLCGKTFVDLLVYLSLFADEYIPAGIYKNIE